MIYSILAPKSVSLNLAIHRGATLLADEHLCKKMDCNFAYFIVKWETGRFGDKMEVKKQSAVRLLKNNIYPTYQLYAEMANDKTPAERIYFLAVYFCLG